MRENKLLYNYINSYCKMKKNKNVFKRRYYKTLVEKNSTHLRAWSDNVFEVLEILMDFIIVNGISSSKLCELTKFNTRRDSQLFIFRTAQGSIVYNTLEKKLVRVTNDFNDRAQFEIYKDYIPRDTDKSYFVLYEFCHDIILDRTLELFKAYIDENKDFKWVGKEYIYCNDGYEEVDEDD